MKKFPVALRCQVTDGTGYSVKWKRATKMLLCYTISITFVFYIYQFYINLTHSSTENIWNRRCWLQDKTLHWDRRNKFCGTSTRHDNYSHTWNVPREYVFKKPKLEDYLGNKPRAGRTKDSFLWEYRFSHTMISACGLRCSGPFCGSVVQQ